MEMLEAVEDEVETEFEFVVDAVCGSERMFSYLEEMRVLLRGDLLAGDRVGWVISSAVLNRKLVSWRTCP